MKKLKTAVLSVLLIALSTSVFAAAKTATVAIVPFKVNAEKDMSFLRDGVYDMLSSRLTKEGEVEVLNRQTVEKALPSTAGPLTEAAAGSSAGNWRPTTCSSGASRCSATASAWTPRWWMSPAPSPP